jgi:hypothetical protein
MVSNRSYYAVLTLCLLGCGKSAAVKDDTTKTPASCECVSPKASEESKTEQSEGDAYGPLPPELLQKRYSPIHGRPHSW